jgi:hypothetical protein
MSDAEQEQPADAWGQLISEERHAKAREHDRCTVVLVFSRRDAWALESPPVNS